MNNTCNGNTGYRNTGYRNTGNYSTGDYNTGHYNIGKYNTGHYNTGNHNAGRYNTGHGNTGDHNTGNCNTGNCNTGDHNTGFFCTETPCVTLFDKKTEITFKEFYSCKAYKILTTMPSTVSWVEKEENETHGTTDGYLKKCCIETANNEWWDSLTNGQRHEILSLKHFDAAKFKKCTGIDIVDRNSDL